MKLIPAFFRLVRWPNLLFIAVTQVLFYYCILLPVFTQLSPGIVLPQLSFYLLVAASVCIAAAGYIINDYFDLNIDRVNKPDKLVVDKVIKRRWAILWHLLLSGVGMILTALVCFLIWDWHVFLAGFINFLCVAALWVYSTTYKKKLLIGNVLISLLTAWTILVLYMVSLHIRTGAGSWELNRFPPGSYDLALARLFKFAILYAGFAFIISLVREVIKDMEDMEGDAKYGCRTMPIVWGVPASKMFVAVWIVVLVAALLIIQFYVLQFDWWWSAAYCLVLIILPLLWILRKLYQAKVQADYHRLSSAVKAVMLTGILSMIFFKIYQ